MISMDYQILIDRLEAEIEKKRNYIRKSEQEGKSTKVAIEYIKHHVEMIKFIKALDKELY